MNEVSIRGLTHYEASTILKVSQSLFLKHLTYQPFIFSVWYADFNIKILIPLFLSTDRTRHLKSTSY